ncbi:hypothetical protein PAXRUDRAFT_36771 [Paxillus rubicundulus Ve08.2h10]|uniref:CxC2-like cysteine cluster KDZ transposase-associated domain-containing protein n=1 Tax=Paxillus rubicundulus Ve08.2h10 TaxID=930991 RepID=A0A0D0DHQ4_9AGAM|nr:hypothetical protein PAXRUDRAFT_36771 [Paxillus rubicundulus Ve08.2h10]
MAIGSPAILCFCGGLVFNEMWGKVILGCGCAEAVKDILKQFHLLSFKSKAFTYEFYHALKCCSNNTGLSEHKDHYEAFMQMISHDPDGPENTQPGDCVVMCPTCPHPRTNLLANWETRKNVLNNEVDLGLGSGWAYFVDETDYKSYKSTCLGHPTVNMSDTKVSHGLAETGVGTVDCSCHGFKLPHGIGDLQKGESEYLNMDYMFFLVLQHHLVKCFFMSYNIACQWSKKLWTWMLNMPPALQFDGQGKAMEFGVPKFHLPAHKEPCQTLYSPNFLPFCGWANVNPVASSTTEMGPGSRQDTLDDFFGDWNWKKVLMHYQLGHTLLKKMEEAVDQKLEQEVMHQNFKSTLDHEAISVWTMLVEAWEGDRKKPNPYEWKGEVMSQVKVQLELARDEAQRPQHGNYVSLHAKISPSILIIQILYMPLVAQQCSPKGDIPMESVITELQPHTYKLWLPSEKPELSSILLQNFEWKLCYAQAFDSLKDLHSQSLEKVGWERTLQELKDEHIHALSVGEGGQSEGRHTMSWIWQTTGVLGNDNADLQESLQIEWCKSQA